MQDNILFGAYYDAERYKKGVIEVIRSRTFFSDEHPVIYQCGLKRDLSLLEAGDATEVGEKGLTLRYVTLTPQLKTVTK